MELNTRTTAATMLVVSFGHDVPRPTSNKNNVIGVFLKDDTFLISLKKEYRAKSEVCRESECIVP